MPRDFQKIITLARADSRMVPLIANALVEKMDFKVTLEPTFGVDGGAAQLERDGLEVHLSWSSSDVLIVTTRNRKFEETRDSMVELIRSLNSEHANRE